MKAVSVQVNEGLLSKLMHNHDLKFTLNIGEKIFALSNVSIEKSKTPVRKPTTRGGVYFDSMTAYKITATTEDLTILELLPGLMLGPNTEFKPVEVKTSLDEQGRGTITLVSHITNTMNTNALVGVNLIIDKTLIEDSKGK